MTVYKKRNEFVADFIGKINLLAGTVRTQDEEISVVDIQEEGFPGPIHTPRTDFSTGRRVPVSVRPENIQIHTSKPDQEVNTWAGSAGAEELPGRTLRHGRSR